MKDSYDKLFKRLGYLEPPAGLSERIMRSISERSVARAIWMKTILSGVLSTVATIALVWSWFITQSEVAQSGFSQFFSLLVSDTNMVTVLWRQFSMSIIESFPVIGAIAILGSLLVLLVSVRSFMRDIAAIKITYRPKLNGS